METKHELKTWVCEPAVLPAAMPEDEVLELYEIEASNEEKPGRILIKIYTDKSIIEIEID